MPAEFSDAPAVALPPGLSSGGNSVGGLSTAEAEARLKEYGPNEIPAERSYAAIAFLRKFWGPIPWMLEATTLLQIALGKIGEAAVIVSLLLVNAGISFAEEDRVGKALDLLRHRLSATARVFRDGAWRSAASAALVPGDLVHLRMGDLSPADVRIAQGNILLDQSVLTGESMAVSAGPGAIAYAAAVVRRGEATGEVVATGARTYFGKTAQLVRTAKATSHLTATIFGIVRILIALDAVLIAALLSYTAWVGLPLRDALPFTLILLVASVPVALPATFTLATALGAAELAQSGVLLTRLTAIEEAAGMDVLLTDKTGTLTENRLKLTQIQRFAAAEDDAVLLAAALASDPATQDPIDLAILGAAQAQGLLADPLPRLAFEPFDPATRYSLGRYRRDDGESVFVKGAPRAVCALVGAESTANQVTQRLAGSGARVLAVAQGRSREHLQLLGLIALEDPPRPDSQTLVEGLKALGIRVAMVTGDNAITAEALARHVGIEGPVAPPGLLNPDHDGGPAGLDYGIYARVFPEDKIRLVRLLQEAGHVVGMTGDGVNDAPALKQADMGIAVASATDVARAAAGIVLTAAGLTNALTAVTISRRIYQRMLTYTINKIMKTLEIAIFLTIGVMVTHAFVIRPLLIVLLLFTNDFVTMSIATDHVGFSPRPERWNVRELMLTGSILAGLMLALSFSVYFFGRDVLGLRLPELQTLIFVMLVATGQGNIYLVRERGHFWRSSPSRWLLISSIVDLAVVSLMAAMGIMMTPVPPTLIIALLSVIALYLLILDQLKVKMFAYLVAH